MRNGEKNIQFDMERQEESICDEGAGSGWIYIDKN